MVSESASGFIQVAQEIRYQQLRDDFLWISGCFSPYVPPRSHFNYGTPLLQPVIDWLEHHKKPHGHSLSSIRRFKGLT